MASIAYDSAVHGSMKCVQYGIKVPKRVDRRRVTPAQLLSAKNRCVVPPDVGCNFPSCRNEASSTIHINQLEEICYEQTLPLRRFGQSEYCRGFAGDRADHHYIK